jgi:biotin transport system substrate-specific component
MHSTLAVALWPRIETSLLRQVVLALAGSLLLTVSAKIQVPFWPVPMTMQTFVVLMIGATFGLRLGAATVGLYLAEGLVGLPVFAQGGGAAQFAGPTGGYLIGFMAAAMLVGYLVQRGLGRNLATALATFVLAELVIFACGIGWLAGLIGLERAFAAGLLPFLPAEALKLGLATALLPFAWRLARR